MNKSTKEERYLKVIESIGELLLNRDEKIKFNEYEIEALKKKINNIEKYIEYYQHPVDEILEKSV